MADDLDDKDDDLSSFLDKDDDDDGEDSLSSFFDDEKDDDDGDDEEDLSSFFDEEDEDEDDEDEDEDDEDEDEDGFSLSSFFGDDEDEKPKKKGKSKDPDSGGGLLGSITGKPTPLLPFKVEKRKARIDITKTSKETPKDTVRYTQKELSDRIRKEYTYMLGKPYMIIQPILIMADYPFKKKRNDTDAITAQNVIYDYALVFGKQIRWRSQISFKKKPHRIGEIMYVRRGLYWVNGEELELDPHFAIIVKKSHKRIKFKRIRDLFLPVKQRLRSGKPFEVYKEFPILIKRTGSFS